MNYFFKGGGSATPSRGSGSAWDPNIANTPARTSDYEDYNLEEATPSPAYNPGGGGGGNTPGYQSEGGGGATGPRPYTPGGQSEAGPYTPATPGILVFSVRFKFLS